jgi:hypothetical protein
VGPPRARCTRAKTSLAEPQSVKHRSPRQKAEDDRSEPSICPQRRTPICRLRRIFRTQMSLLRWR